MLIRIIGSIFLVFTLFYPTIAQETDQESKEKGYHRHHITIMMANSHIPTAKELNEQRFIYIAPTWGFNYNYWFSEKWALGLHNNVIIQRFKIESKDDHEVIEREAPVSISGVALFKPWEKWTLGIGAGREFEKHESFNLISAELEYGVELPGNWELGFILIYENKIKTYYSWMFGVGFSKMLGYKNWRIP